MDNSCSIQLFLNKIDLIKQSLNQITRFFIKIAQILSSNLSYFLNTHGLPIIMSYVLKNSFLSDEDALDLHRTIDDVCNNPDTKFRNPCSENEKKAAKYFKKRMLEYTNEVRTENFWCNKGAFLGSISLSGVFLLLTLILYFIYPLVSPIVGILGLLFFPLEFMALKRFVEGIPVLNFFFPKRKSQNVLGILKPTEKTKRIYVIGGHMDSAKYFPITARFRGRSHYIALSAFVIAALVMISVIIRVVRTIENGSILQFVPPLNPISHWGFLDIFTVLCFISSIYAFWVTFGFVSLKNVQGANDNLSGCACTLGLLKYFKEHPLKNVEVWACVFGSEEEGQRGSTNFVKTHLDELKEKDAYCVNFESCGSGEKLTILTAMLSNGLKGEPEAYNSLFNSAQKIEQKIPVTLEPLRDCYSDSEPFSKYKAAKATTIIGLDNDFVPHIWHMLEDVPQNVSITHLKQTTEMGIQWLLDADNEISKKEG